MGQITLRGIPAEIESIAQREAKSRGISLNKVFLDLLRSGAEQGNLKRHRKDKRERVFSQFLGLWSGDEEMNFGVSLKEQRQIDKDLWK